MAYFSTSEAYDNNLIADEAYGSLRLKAVSEQVEREVINRYTDLLRRRPIGEDYDQVFELADNVRGVFLRGYKSDITLADGYNTDRSKWTGLAAALRSVIANLTSHRVMNFSVDPGIVSESRGARSVTRKGPVNKSWPVGWDEPLRFYDIRPAVYHL